MNKVYSITAKAVCFFIFFFSALETFSHPAIEEENKNIHLIIVPGIVGIRGHREFEVSPVITDFIKLPRENYHIVETPLWAPDMGQGRCQKPLQLLLDTLLQDKRVGHILCFGTSQGASTLLNVLKDTKYHDKLLGVILQSPLVRATGGVIHSVKNILQTNHWGADFITPMLSKVIWPYYSPAGQNAIDDLHKLPDVPFFIAHPKGDPVTPPLETMGLIWKMQQERKNVSFCTPELNLHCGIFLHKGNMENFKDYVSHLPRIVYGKNPIEGVSDFHNAGTNLQKFLKFKVQIATNDELRFDEAASQNRIEPEENHYKKVTQRIENYKNFSDTVRNFFCCVILPIVLAMAFL